MFANQGFGKSARLLNATDYSRVFDKAEYRVSSKEFLLLVRSNQNLGARLGLIIAKKHVKLAVQRNRLKRVIRESFRCHFKRSLDLDIVVLARPGSPLLTKAEIHSEIVKLWSKLERKLGQH